MYYLIIIFSLSYNVFPRSGVRGRVRGARGVHPAARGVPLPVQRWVDGEGVWGARGGGVSGRPGQR